MRRSFAREPLTAEIHCVLADATALPFRDDFDLILCDAPCSGTGTLARNPEIKLRLARTSSRGSRSDSSQLCALPTRLLAPGGSLVYSTCSLEREENLRVIQAFLASEPSARLLDVRERVDALEAEGRLHPDGARLLRETALRDGCLQTIPGVVPCDGFFVAIVTR